MQTDELGETRTTRWPQRLGGLRGIRWADVPREVSAGVTLAALVHSAQYRAMPKWRVCRRWVRLYAAIISTADLRLVHHSRHVVGAPDASIAALGRSRPVGLRHARGPAACADAQALAVMCGLLLHQGPYVA